jgi:predicted O-methyltransferase YrrM
MIKFVKQYLGNHHLVGVEIGVLKGANALSILQELPIQRLYLIDPYYSDEDRTAKQILSGYSQCVWIKKPSDEAWQHIRERLDFVYIDGDHTYNQVIRDIEHYLCLLKPGGVLGGHDYPIGDGVKNAVDDWFEQHKNFRLFTLFPDWWTIKNANST